MAHSRHCGPVKGPKFKSVQRRLPFSPVSPSVWLYYNLTWKWLQRCKLEALNLEGLLTPPGKDPPKNPLPEELGLPCHQNPSPFPLSSTLLRTHMLLPWHCRNTLRASPWVSTGTKMGHLCNRKSPRNGHLSLDDFSTCYSTLNFVQRAVCPHSSLTWM